MCSQIRASASKELRKGGKANLTFSRDAGVWRASGDEGGVASALGQAMKGRSPVLLQPLAILLLGKAAEWQKEIQC